MRAQSVKGHDASCPVTAMFLALPTALRLLIAPLLSVLKYQDTYSAAQVPQQLAFSLRHQHAVANDSRILFADAPPSFLTTEYILSTKYIRTHRPRSSEAFNKARMNAFLNSQTDADLWTMSDTSAPNVDNRETLLELAKMTSNAYYEHEGKGWYDLGSYWGNKVRLDTVIYITHIDDMPFPELPLWVGTRCRRISRPHLCLRR